jgi:dsDNA-specific endonuclease/ATPase MutS2
MVDARVWRQVEDEARESPVRFLDTIITETDKRTCIPNLRILGTTMSTW